MGLIKLEATHKTCLRNILGIREVEEKDEILSCLDEGKKGREDRFVNMYVLKFMWITFLCLTCISDIPVIGCVKELPPKCEHIDAKS